MRPGTFRNIGTYPGFGLLTVLFFVFLYLPIAVLVVFSFNGGTSVTVWDSFSLRWYRAAFENGDLRQALANTLIVACCATVGSVLISIPAALVLTGPFAPARLARLTVGVASLPLIVPEIVIAIATLIFFLTSGISLGLGNVIIAHIVFCTPFALLPIMARLKGMDYRLNEAAHDLYANRWQTFRHVILPQLMTGIIAGGMLAFIVSFDNFIVTLMVAGAGSTTLPIYIYGMVKTQITPEINAISTAVFLLSLLLLVLSTALIGVRATTGGNSNDPD